MQSILAVLRSRGLLPLLGAQYLVYGQLFLALTLLPLYTAHLGGDAWTVGLHTALFTGSGVIMRLYFGPLADRRGRKLPMAIGAFAFASANALFLGADHLGWLAISRVYQAAGLAAYLSAATALVTDLAPVQRRGTAVSLNRGVIALSLLSFPAAGTALAERAGFPVTFVAAGVAGAIGLILLLLTPEGDGTRPVERIRAAAGLQGAGPGFMDLISQPVVRTALMVVAAIALAEVGTTAFVPLHLKVLQSPHYARFFLVLGAAAFASGLAGGLLDRFGAPRVAVAALGACAAGAALLALPVSVPTLLAAAALVGAGYTLGVAAGMAWVLETIPARARATGMALCESAIDGGITVGSPLLGALAVMAGYPAAFLAVAVVCLTAAFAVIRGLDDGGVTRD